MRSLLAALSLPEWRHHPWRSAAAWLAVTMGVALAFSVHLINESALGEFSAAVRQVNAQPDLELRAQRGGFDEQVYARAALHPRIAAASPVIELETQAIGADGRRMPLRVVGLDALAAATLTPEWMPRPQDGEQRFAVVDPGAAYLNAAARERLGSGGTLRVQAGERVATLRIAGSVAAGGAPLAVIDIAGVQSLFGWSGRVSRVDLRFVPGADRDAVLAGLALPEGVRAAEPGEAVQRVSNLSRAYRVNLIVLALVALFTGAFLVFSIVALSVARRLPQFALLGVLGLPARDRLKLVLAECALLGLAGSVAGIALGTGLAWLALRLLGGDLGGAYFPGITPSLRFTPLAALVYGALGVAAALIGGAIPARQAGKLAPAVALKGMGETQRAVSWPWLGPLLIGAGAGLALLPSIGGVPWAAYVAVACLLVGGIACVPAGIGLLLAAVPRPRHALALLAVERARHQRSSATIAVAGVVASLALSVALTVMVASFRDAVADWLDDVLPADLYARTAVTSASADAVFLPEGLPARLRTLPGVAGVQGLRTVPVSLDARQPNVALIARPIGDEGRELPLIGNPVPPDATRPSVWISEPMSAVYRLRAGDTLALPLPDGRRIDTHVRGIWRDYARQHGALAMDSGLWQRLSGDTRINDLAIRLAPGADALAIQRAIVQAYPDAPIEFASARQIREVSLRIFDRSFAVTYWLQAVAIGIGLAGIAASFSAQVLARRREFGLLAHLGLTRRQILTVVAGEGAVWSAGGVVIGLALGIGVAAVLVHVVNPQSFHWTMELRLPLGRLSVLAVAMLAAGTLTAWWAARSLSAQRAALAVKDDW